jgi:uroporphyrinogen-III synthase
VTDQPLAGRTVVVTRSRAQAPKLAEQLSRLGAVVVELPVIAIEEPADHGQGLDRAAHRLTAGAYQWVACTSSNAVARLVAALGGRGVPDGVRWAAVGPGTADALAAAGLVADLVPAVALAEALVGEFPPAGGPGTVGGGPGTVLFPRAEVVRVDLATGLRAKGWLVDEVVAYRTVSVAPDPTVAAAAGRADAVAFTSSSTVRNTVELMGVEGLPPVVVTIGPVTSGEARAAGVEVTWEADPHTIDGLVQALVVALGGDRPVGDGRRRPGGQQ